MNDIYGLTQQQHTAVGDLLQRSGNLTRSEPVPAPRRGFASDFSRVMSLDFPAYSPRIPRPVALFEYDPDQVVVTVRFFGEGLRGLVVLRIQDRDPIELDVRSTTDQLRERLKTVEIDLKYCRATVFPGLWEFHFTDAEIVRKQEPPTLDVDTFYTDSNIRFTGGVIVQREGWVSATDDGDKPVNVNVVDAIPFDRGEVKAGAIALAQRYGADQFMVTNWTCPGFTFAR
jgi:hypothetical protein